jgi:hypothetical protein
VPWCGPTDERPFPSLGWDILKWTRAFLPSPSDDAQPLIYTPAQARRVVEWFEIHPITGEFVRLRLVLEEAKGYGKSPFAGSLDIVEFRGPVCFDGWDANGQPVGVPWGTGHRPRPWIQIAAVSEDQTDNTYGAMYSMLAARGGKIADELGIDLGRTRLLVKDMPGALLEPVTASAGSREGQRLTHATLDETHLWTPRNGGVKLARTIRRNLAKMGGRSVETTNAPQLGERSVAEQSDPDHPESGVLHYARRARTEPTPEWSDERLVAELEYVYDDGAGKPVAWSDPPRLVREMRDPANTWDDALRFWYNLRTAGAGRAVDPKRWAALAKLQDVPAGTAIGLGFDGSISQDATVLRAYTADGYGFLVRAWVRPVGAALDEWFAKHPGEPDWHVDRTDVASTIAETFARYRVGRMICDPPKWPTEVEAWQTKYGLDPNDEPIVRPLWTNSAARFAPPCDRWLSAIREGVLSHDGDPLTADHVRAAVLKKVVLADNEADGRTRYVIDKGEDRQRIDAAVADILAYEAAMTMTVPPVRERPPLFIGRA